MGTYDDIVNKADAEQVLNLLNKLAGADISKYEVAIWNAAIEAAAKELETYDATVEQIRKLKK